MSHDPRCMSHDMSHDPQVCVHTTWHSDLLGHVFLLQFALSSILERLQEHHSTHNHGGSHQPGVIPVERREEEEREQFSQAVVSLSLSDSLAPDSDHQFGVQ